MHKPSAPWRASKLRLLADMHEAKHGVEGKFAGGGDWFNSQSRYEIKRVFARRAGANQGKAELKL